MFLRQCGSTEPHEAHKHYESAENYGMAGNVDWDCMGVPEPRTINYAHRAWGHDYTFDPIDGGMTGRIVGWCTPLPEVGDYMLLRNGQGTTRYRVTSVRGYGTPVDMYEAQVAFDPRVHA